MESGCRLAAHLAQLIHLQRNKRTAALKRLAADYEFSGTSPLETERTKEGTFVIEMRSSFFRRNEVLGAVEARCSSFVLREKWTEQRRSDFLPPIARVRRRPARVCRRRTNNDHHRTSITMRRVEA